jgi:hypothetical protein
MTPLQYHLLKTHEPEGPSVRTRIDAERWLAPSQRVRNEWDVFFWHCNHCWPMDCNCRLITRGN